MHLGVFFKIWFTWKDGAKHRYASLPSPVWIRPLMTGDRKDPVHKKGGLFYAVMKIKIHKCGE